MLHILDVAPEGTNARLIPSTCGHQCVASERTHVMLADDRYDHTIYCLACASKEIS